MEDCTKFDSLLGAYLDGELDEEESQRVALHLKKCSPCQKNLEEFQGFFALAGRYQPPQVTSQEWDHCLQKIRESSGPTLGPSSLSAFPYGWLLWGGAAVAALVLAYFVLSPYLIKDTPGTPKSPRKELAGKQDPKPEKAPVDKVNNESSPEYLETGEGYTCSVEVPASKEEMCVITVEKQE